MTGQASIVSEQQVRLAAQLYDIRDAARQLRGDSYKADMEIYGKVIQTVADREGISVLAAASQLCKRNGLTGFSVITFMAAAVEIMEPST